MINDKCISIIKDFLLENRVKLNDNKIELLIIGTANKLKKVSFDAYGYKWQTSSSVKIVLY